MQQSPIFDDSQYISEYARFILRSHSDNSQADKYRRKLSELQNKVSASVVAGLAKTGKQEDITLMQTIKILRSEQLPYLGLIVWEQKVLIICIC